MSRKSKQRDIQPIDQSKVENDLNILFELLEKIREFLEDPNLFHMILKQKWGKLVHDARLVQLGLKGIIDFLYDDDANWPLEKDP